MYPELLEIEASLKKAETSYRNITWLPSKDLEEKRKGNLIKIEKIESYLTTLNKNFPTFLDILGNSKKQRYLIVFQNADEIRPT